MYGEIRKNRRRVRRNGGYGLVDTDADGYRECVCLLGFV